MYCGNTKIYYSKTVGHVFTKHVERESTKQKLLPMSNLFFIVIHISAAR